MAEQVFMKLRITWQLSSSERRTPQIPPIDLCACMCIPPTVTRQRLGKHVPGAVKTSKNIVIVGCVCLWACLYIPLWLLGNNSVKTFPGQRKFFGNVVFRAVHVVSKERRLLVLLSITCFYFNFYHLRRQDFVNWMVASITQSIGSIFFSWIKSWSVTVAPLKIWTYHIFKESIIIVLWFCPAFWWRETNTYLVFSVFTSIPSSLLAPIRDSVFYFMVSMLSPRRFTLSA
jgi:hypothetical protein